MSERKYIGGIKTWPRCWFIEFAFKLKSVKNTLQNIFQITKKGDPNGKFPTVFLRPNSNRLKIEYSIDSIIPVISDNQVYIQLNQYNHLRIENRYIDTFTFRFRIIIDNIVKKEIIYYTNDFLEFSDVEVYRSSNNEASNALIKNFIYGAFKSQPGKEEGKKNFMR